MRRVVVTGIGVVTAFGRDARAFGYALREGRSAATALDQPDAVRHGVGIGAPVQGFNPAAFVDPKALRLMAPAVAFGVTAAEFGIRTSELSVDRVEPSRFGVFIGSRGHSSDQQDLLPGVRAATDESGFHLDAFGARGMPLVSPMWLLKGLANNVLYFLSLKYNAQGINANLSLGGVGATLAIGEAFEAIQRGYADVALAGGYDSALDADRFETYGASGLITRTGDPSGAGRPFDRRRDGFVPGEGAAMIVLETLDGAKARNAQVHAEVCGYGSATASMPTTPTTPVAAGFAQALDTALSHAGRFPDAVFAHGLGTRESDREETQAIKIALGSRATSTPIPAIKSMIGNTMAASGALELVAGIQSLQEGWLPPTINLTQPDPECDLDYVAGSHGRPVRLETIALLNANLAGAYGAIVLSRV